MWIGVDFDGTLRREDGSPIILMIERVKHWLEEGKEVRIVTARLSAERDDRDYQIRYIDLWCQVMFGFKLPIQWGKSTGMLELWDDKVVRIERGTGRKLSPSFLDKDNDHTSS